MVSALNIGVYLFLFTSLYFEVFLLITYLEERGRVNRKDARPSSPASYPSVTIIVPCYNEEKTITQTIQSLIGLRYPREKLHIMVVDDGSTDTTYEKALQFTKHGEVSVFTKQNGGKASALNFGIMRADTELIGGLDADSFVAPEALQELVRYFASPEVMAVTPAITVHEPRTLLQHMQQAEYHLSIFYRKMFCALDALFVTPGPFSIYRAEVFKKIGLFRDAHKTEDMEMALRMQTHRMKIENTPAALVSTVVPATLPVLLRQRVRWVQGFLQNSIDYRALFLKRAHGNLGFFVLPVAVISIFGSIYFAFYILFNMVTYFLEKALQVQTVGLANTFSTAPQFDLFFLTAESSTFLIVILLALTVALLSIGKWMVNDALFSRGTLLYLFFYGFIAPLWLAKAVYNTAFSRQSAWK